MKNNFRFYSFVAGLYLSPIQCGIQTAHAVGDMSVKSMPDAETKAYKEWAEMDKVLIVCQAINHAGVMTAYEALQRVCPELQLPIVLFREDEQSMCGMATAAGVVVPEKYYDAKPFFALYADRRDGPDYFEYAPEGEMGRIHAGTSTEIFNRGTPQYQFIQFLKSYKLA